MEHSGGCAGTTEYYRSTGETVLYDNWEGYVATAENYMSSREAVLVQWSTTGALVRRSLYSRVLHDYLAGCAGTIEYYKNTWVAVLVQ